MVKMLSFFLLIVSLKAVENLYLHIPNILPSEYINTSFGYELKTLIDNAKSEISFAIYGLRGQNDILNALIAAKERGIEVRGVVDSDTHDRNYYSDTKLLHKHFEIVSDHKSYIMHNKFFIIDKETVWTGSSNISDTGTGGYNANSAIIIENRTVARIYQKEFEQMFEDGRFGRKKRSITFENIETEESTISIYFSPKSNTYENGIKSLVKNAKEYIYIPIFYLTHKDLSLELIEAKERGVEIKIILDATAARNKYSQHRNLRKNGVKVKVENFGGKMHAKSIIVDDRYFVTGSMNLSKAGNRKNDENTMIIENQKLAKRYRDYFLQLWSAIPEKYLHRDPNPESLESGNSCFDGFDNDFDKKVDLKDKMCLKDYL